MNKYQYLMGFSLAGLTITFGLYFSNVTLNATDSIKNGFYLLSEKRSFNKGDVATFCQTDDSIPAVKLALDRKYYEHEFAGRCYKGSKSYQYLMKPIVATAGDNVVLNKEGLFVNDIHISNSRILDFDSKHRPMTHYPFGTYTVDKGEVWVIGTHHPNSFDSRYFGPIQMYGIRYTAIPLLTWG